MQGLLSTWQQMIRRAEVMAATDSPLLPAYIEIWRHQVQTLKTLPDYLQADPAATRLASFKAQRAAGRQDGEAEAVWQILDTLGAHGGVGLFDNILGILERHLALSPEEIGRARELLGRLGWQGLIEVASGRQSIDWEAVSPLRQTVWDFAVAATFQPFFHCLAHETGTTPEIADDENGASSESCPFCASPALLSVIRSSDRKRVLVCGLCGSQWPVARASCPYCGENDPERYHFLYAEEQPAYRVEVCESCGRHLREVDEKRLGRKAYPLLDDVLTLPLEERIRREKEGARN